MEDKINEYVLKLTGKANIPVPLKVGSSYTAKIEGAITSETKEDNDDGTYNVYFKFQPIIAEITNENGVTTKTKDLRKDSQKMRAIIRREWEDSNNSEKTEEEYYRKRMSDLMRKIIEGEI